MAFPPLSSPKKCEKELHASPVAEFTSAPDNAAFGVSPDPSHKECDAEPGASLVAATAAPATAVLQPPALPVSTAAAPAAAQPTADCEQDSCCDMAVEFLAHWFGPLRFDHLPDEKGPPKPAKGEKPKAKLKQHWENNKRRAPKRSASGGSNGSPAVSPSHAAKSPVHTPTQLVIVRSPEDKEAQDASQDQLRSAANPQGDELVYDGRYFVMFNYPIFTVSWVALVFALWVIGSLASGLSLAGFESIWPGQTELAVVDVDHCSDFRGHIWRWWTYQFSHVGFSHVFLNSVMMLMFGIPLEGWHGSLRTFFMFQVGVFGGTCCFLVWDNHGRVVGMSGGCYALIGMHFGDLLMNFKDKKFARTKVALLVIVAIIDMIQVWALNSQQTSHSAHFGGFVAGLCICTFMGHNQDVLEWEKTVRIVAVAVACVLVVFSLAWGLTWAPMELQDPVRWCWLRQVMSQEHFGDGRVRCVRCDSQDCIDRWSAVPNQAISAAMCFNEFGGFARSER